MADGTGFLWAGGSPGEPCPVNGGSGIHVHGLAWHPDGRSFAAAVVPDGSAPAGVASRVAIFDAKTLKELTSLATRGHQPFCCAFSPDGRLLAAGGGSTDRDADGIEKTRIAASCLVLKGEQVEATPGWVPRDDAVARVRKRPPDGREHSGRCCRK